MEAHAPEASPGDGQLEPVERGRVIEGGPIEVENTLLAQGLNGGLREG
jgi:hypothetical protein